MAKSSQNKKETPLPQTVKLTLTIDRDQYKQIVLRKNKLRLLHEQDLIRIYIAQGLEQSS